MVRPIQTELITGAADRARRKFFQGLGAAAVTMTATAVHAHQASSGDRPGPEAPLQPRAEPATAASAPSALLAPTGEQYEIRRGKHKAVVTEVGATLRSYQVGQRELLDTFGPDEMSRYGMGHVLAPWPGRIDQGRYVFQGVTQQLPLNETANQNALHGLVRCLDWRLKEHSDDSVTLGLVLFPTDGYPFTLELAVTYRLTDRGLAVRSRATNRGAGPLPFGLGFHPYFNLGTDSIDTHVLTLPAATYLPTNERLVPIGSSPVSETAFDFRKPKPIGATKLDTTFTDLIRGKDGRARIRLTGPQGNPSIELAMDASFRYVVAYTQDTLPDPRHRRRGVCLEPLTCAPNAFNSGKGLLTLEAGKSYTGEWSLEGRA
jgi:galactose mutarotase-like enzyme